jgi:V/A-type H+-transporting ATPase subunit K
MREVSGVKHVGLVLGLMVVMTLLFAGVALAQAEPAPGGAAGTGAGLLGLAAAISVGLGAIGTAWAQSRIGAAAAGAIAERPEIGGLMLVFLALPETMIILGFLVAFFVIGKI